ncbi:MAG: molybdate ABC transporter substrate-binding protein [Syntrophales bacterium]|jgi:molybdate transport system substrate-binding protein|nr:molybdate ABC transporter substrate-binding protein [Syntrophales bacterium]
MKSGFTRILILFLVISGVFFAKEGTCGDPVKLNLYAAAGLKKPMDVVVDKFSKEYGVKIFPNYGPSGGLYTQIIKGQPCDIYFSADWMLIEKLKEKKLLAEGKKILKDVMVLVVSKTGEEKKIKTFADLTKEGVVLSIADPRAPVGMYAEKGLRNLGLFDKIIATGNLKAKPSTVNQVAILVEKDQVDAGMIFKSVANMYKLNQVASMGYDVTGDISFGIGIIKGENEDMAKKFMAFTVAHIDEFVKYGWQPYE